MGGGALRSREILSMGSGSLAMPPTSYNFVFLTHAFRYLIAMSESCIPDDMLGTASCTVEVLRFTGASSNERILILSSSCSSFLCMPDPLFHFLTAPFHPARSVEPTLDIVTLHDVR